MQSVIESNLYLYGQYEQGYYEYFEAELSFALETAYSLFYFSCPGHRCEFCYETFYTSHNCGHSKRCGDLICINCNGCIGASKSDCRPCVCGYNCSHAKCGRCGKCTSSVSSVYCPPCTCPKICSDEKCTTCGGCLAGIGGRSSAYQTRANVTHTKCSCPVLCEACGETQMDAETGMANCSDKNYRWSYAIKLTPNNLLAGCNDLWNSTRDTGKEQAGHYLSNGVFLVHRLDKNTISATYDLVNRCTKTGFFVDFKSRQIYKDIKVIAHVHTHPTTRLKDRNVTQEKSYLIGISPNDIDVVNKYNYGYVITDGVVFKYNSQSQGDVMCPMVYKLAKGIQ